MIANSQEDDPQRLYDRIAEVHNLALRVNGYKRSVGKFLQNFELDIGEEARVLDAGSGTGIITLGFYRAGLSPKQMVDVDLSYNSLKIGKEEFRRDKLAPESEISSVQGNVLTLPFLDQSFDLVITCGVLEYVPLNDGLKEFARVLKPDGRLVLIPIKPSLVGKVLKLMYKFQIHTIENVKAVAEKYFEVDGNYKFPITDPIGWSKTLFLLRRKSE